MTSQYSIHFHLLASVSSPVLNFVLYPLLLWIFLVCFACYALLHIRGPSYSPPLIRHYVSYLISTFVETTPGLMAPTRECTHLTNRVTSQWELVTIFFQACEANRHIFSEKHLTKISSRAGVEPQTFRSRALRFTTELCPPYVWLLVKIVSMRRF